MRYYDCRSLFLSCLLGVTAGLGLLPLSPALVMVQSSELGSQKPQESVIKTCTGQLIDLGTPQLTDADLKGLTRCSSEVMPQLLEALKAQDWKVKVTAAHTFGLFSTEAQAAIPALSDLLQDENADVRFVAAQVLGKIGTAAVVPALTKALQDKDENVRVSAATAFQQLGNMAKLAKPALIMALWDGNWYVRSRVAATISKLGLEESDIPNLLEPWRDGFQPETGALVSLMIVLDPHIRNQIQDVPLFFIKALQNKDPKVRESAAIALGEINPTRASEVYLFDSANALLKVRWDTEPKVRERAVQALGSVISGFEYPEERRNREKRPKVDKEPSFTPQLAKIQSALLQSLKDSDPSVRQVAVDSLERISNYKVNSSNIISALLKQLQDPDAGVRQDVMNSLRSRSHYLEYRAASLSSVERTRLTQAISSTLIKFLYDQDEGVRRTAWMNLSEKDFLPTLTKVLQNQTSNLEVRRTALAATWARKISLDENATDLLNRALQDPDSTIRLSAALALRGVRKLNSKTAVAMFIEELRSSSPALRLDAITGLNQLCFKDSEDSEDIQACLNAKVSLPLLIDALRDEIKPIQYAAALAIANIESKEENGVKVLSKILLEEPDLRLRGHATNALQKIGSQYALSTMTLSLQMDDKQARYSRSCLYNGYMPTGKYVNASPNNSVLPFFERFSLLLKALEDANVRFSSAETFNSFAFDKTENFVGGRIATTGLISVFTKYSNQYDDHLILKNTFKLKNQDLRRGAVYALGRIGSNIQLTTVGVDSVREDLQRNAQRSQMRRKITEALMAISNDKTEDLDVRWVAAASLQKMSIDVNQFFIENKLVNPKTARWQFPHGGTPWRQERFTGGIIIFDIYSSNLLYDTRGGCGDGLLEIYNTLRNLLAPKKK